MVDLHLQRKQSHFRVELSDIWATHNLFGMVLYEESAGDIAVMVIIIKSQIHCKELLGFHLCRCPRPSCSKWHSNKIFDFTRTPSNTFLLLLHWKLLKAQLTALKAENPALLSGVYSVYICLKLLSRATFSTAQYSWLKWHNNRH